MSAREITATAPGGEDCVSDRADYPFMPSLPRPNPQARGREGQSSKAAGADAIPAGWACIQSGARFHGTGIAARQAVRTCGTADSARTAFAARLCRFRYVLGASRMCQRRDAGGACDLGPASASWLFWRGRWRGPLPLPSTVEAVASSERRGRRACSAHTEFGILSLDGASARGRMAARGLGVGVWRFIPDHEGLRGGTFSPCVADRIVASWCARRDPSRTCRSATGPFQEL
jgi:hypothetical protein